MVKERFIIKSIVGEITLKIFFSTMAGTESRSQYESDD